MRISATPNLYTTQNKPQQTPVHFGGFTQKLTDNRLYNAIESGVIKGCFMLADTKAMKSLVEKTTNKTKKSPKFIDEKLTSHLIVLGSTILSGFYILKTIKNKDLDEEKRKTLAINQGLTYAVSTAMAYTFDNWLTKGYNKFIDNFKDANKAMGKTSEEIDKWGSGLKLAKSIIIIDTVYRFIAPVMVTPIANWCGNKLKEHKKAHHQ